MFMDLDGSLVRQHNEELMREARKWHLQSRLRTNREQNPGTRPRADRTGTHTAVIELSKERPVRSMRALALGLLGRQKNSYGSTTR